MRRLVGNQVPPGGGVSLPSGDGAGADVDLAGPSLALGRRRVVLRNNSSANAAVRELWQPAPTLYFGRRMNYCAWELETDMTDEPDVDMTDTPPSGSTTDPRRPSSEPSDLT